MHDYLGQHPEIFMIELPGKTIKGTPIAVRELHYFGSDVNLWWFPGISEEEYLGFFSSVTDQKRVGERSVSYLGSRRAAREIMAFAPLASIIVMLRNPVDLLHSLHNELLYHDYEEIADFETALSAEEDRTCGQPAAEVNLRFVNAEFYREVVDFTPQVKRYFDVFGRRNVHVILYEDLERDTPGSYRTVLRFLGVDENFVAEFRIINAFKDTRSRSRNGPSMVPCDAAKPASLEAPAGPHPGALATAPRARPPIDTAIRHRLAQRCLPDLERLSELLDQDLRYWGPRSAGPVPG